MVCMMSESHIEYVVFCCTNEMKMNTIFDGTPESGLYIGDKVKNNIGNW